MGDTTSPGRADCPSGQLPMGTTIEDALPLLRRPFSPRAVRAKAQNQDREKPPTGARSSATSTPASYPSASTSSPAGVGATSTRRSIRRFARRHETPGKRRSTSSAR